MTPETEFHGGPEALEMASGPLEPVVNFTLSCHHPLYKVWFCGRCVTWDTPRMPREDYPEWLKRHLCWMPAEAGACYKNAAAMAILRPRDVEYHEGWVFVHGIPIEHAWNVWRSTRGPILIDVTLDACDDVLRRDGIDEPGDARGRRHGARIPTGYVRKVLFSTGWAGQMLFRYFVEKCVNSRAERDFLRKKSQSSPVE